MEHYIRGRRVEEKITRASIPIPNLDEDFIWIQVAPGSKMRNLLCCAVNSINEGKQVVWTGVGATVGKAISCAEILKRKFNAFQISKICYKSVEEHWEPRTGDLDTIIVKREVPAIHILISKEALDVNEPGYQSPTEYRGFWQPAFLPSKGSHRDPCRSKNRRRSDFRYSSGRN